MVTTTDPAALAEALGVPRLRPANLPALMEALLDDEWEALPRDDRDKLSKLVANAPGDLLARCAPCGALSLRRYQPGDARCRVCGAADKSEHAPRSAIAESAEAPAQVLASAPVALELAFAEGRELPEPSDFDGGQTVVLPPFVAPTLSDSESDMAAVAADPEDGVVGDRTLILEAFAADVDAAREATPGPELVREIVASARRDAAEEARREAQAAAQLALEEQLLAQRRAFEAELAQQRAAFEAQLAEQRAAMERALQQEREARAQLEAQLSAAAQAREQADAAVEVERARLEEEARRAAAAAEQELEVERRRREDAERARAEAVDARRPAVGVVAGRDAGRVRPIPLLPFEGPGDETAIYLTGEAAGAAPRLYVRGRPAWVDGEEIGAGRELDLRLGSAVRLGDEVVVVDERQELGQQVAEAIHVVRHDGQPGGPWPYWNDELEVGSSADCGLRLIDDGVAPVHARVVTRFGRVVIEDVSSGDCDRGLWVDGEARPWVELSAGVTVRIGEAGPVLRIGKGEAKVKAVAKARAMKPSRHKRTLLEVRDAQGALLRKVFVFTRREVRFGSRSHDVDEPTRMLNEWTLLPGRFERADIGIKQGALVLGGDTIELRRDGGEAMSLNGEDLEIGEPHGLERGFEVGVGDTMAFEGRVYRSPTSVLAQKGPPRLGMKGGHPCECARLDRRNSKQSVIFLVRMLRIGSEPSAPLRIEGLQENHAQILFSQGKFLIVAPRREAPVRLGDVDMDPGAVFPLEIDTTIHLGEVSMTFREVDDSDFLLDDEDQAARPSWDAESADEADEPPVETEAATPELEAEEPRPVIEVEAERGAAVDFGAGFDLKVPLLEVRNAAGRLRRKVFLFHRRKLRFGARAEDGGQLINELPLLPRAESEGDVGARQGMLTLTPDGATLSRAGGAPMLLDGRALDIGGVEPLARMHFRLTVGAALELDGRVFKSAEAPRASGVADRMTQRFGRVGGHPFACIRLERRETLHTYVLLVRSLTIGRGPFAGLVLPLPEVRERHAHLTVEDGRCRLVVPQEGGPVEVDGAQLEPGASASLSVGSTMTIGDARMVLRLARPEDFAFKA